MSTLSTHVLDTALGKPADGIRVTLSRGDAILGEGTTDADGRVKELQARAGALAPGEYRLRFETAGYFEKSKRASFYRDITIDFIVRASGEHYHVPLLLSPFGYSTYRGS
ncbi:MAG: hydroxyisourate hydrolase [Gemmatimonadaceae bacterium]